VAFVALVDTYPHARYWPMTCWADVLIRRTRHHAASIAGMSWREGAAEFIRRVNGLRQKIGARHGAVSGWKDADHAHAPAALRRLRDCGYRAFAQFAPRSYAGKVVFLQAELPSAFPANVMALWGALAPDMEIHKIPCDHMSLSVTHARHVAGVLEKCVKEAVLF
jgi:thioesterase domain-containing protein